MWQLRTQDFLQKPYMHTHLERDILFVTTLKTKESMAFHVSMPPSVGLHMKDLINSCHTLQTGSHFKVTER